MSKKRNMPAAEKAEQKEKKLQIMVGVPAGDTMYTLTAQSLLGMSLILPQERTNFDFAIGSLVYDARNQISYAAVENGADLLLWVDSDMKFEADAVLKLFDTMQETGADLVCGLYTTKRRPIKPTIYKRLDAEPEGETMHVSMETYYDFPKDEPFEVQGCGFAFVLTKVDLFRFLWKYEQPFAPLPLLGEDLSCCYRIRKAGGKMVCDPRVKVEHLGVFEVGADDIEYPEPEAHEG